MDKKIIINRDEHGVSWKVIAVIDYDDLKELIITTINDKYFSKFSRKRKLQIRSLLNCDKASIQKYLYVLQNNETMEFIANSYERFIIYTLCAVLNLRYETVAQYTTKHVGCNEFYPIKTQYPVCGCYYTPPIFWTYYIGDMYNDYIHYSTIPYCETIGVRIYK